METDARVLVIDDDPDVVDSLSLMLETQGYEVDHALSADEGLQKAQDWRPDLILVDVLMPDGTEGFHFVWQLRNHFPVPLSRTPIVILSQIHSTTELRFYPDRSDGYYGPGEFLPVQGFLDKPVSRDELLETVKKALRRRPRAWAVL